MKDKKINIGISDILLLVLSVIFLMGILTVFGPCGPKEDGGWMSCHWAGNSVGGLAAVLAVISLIHLFAPAKVKTGLDLAMIPVAALAAILPSNLIDLCMMETMRCHAIMRPAAILLSVLVAAAAVFDIMINRRKN